MADATICNACGGLKVADRFKACADCREQWRLQARKRGGHADRLDALRDCQRVLAALIDSSRQPHVHASIQPLRAAIIAAEAKARAAISGERRHG
ncbi:hypothetical protein [Paracoccus sp. pheM1]|uniref:hypothetical protein n=1 Tax=Paracoccus sp. pheM1 TaxID=2831675 RepID=UPI00111526E1|nr:hypothetical protein [Paracoccus sp. pheM1]MBT0779586.1 hypothetical protein [Paracoccus sp. pheM1]